MDGTLLILRDKTDKKRGRRVPLFPCAPGMGDNLVVKVRYALGSRKR